MYIFETAKVLVIYKVQKHLDHGNLKSHHQFEALYLQ